MSVSNLCRFGLHIGLNGVAFVKVDRGSGQSWKLKSSGEIAWKSSGSTPERCRDELPQILLELAKEQGISREPIHVSLHNRLCVTRVVTGNRQQVESQLQEISDNSQHYLQLGLGEKLIGVTTVPIDDSRQHGQVAIIKRGLIETIEQASQQAGLELRSIDGALTGICRLARVAELDRSPLLLIWISNGGAEIGISYKGRLQLNYHASGCVTASQVAETIGKHLKRLRRFCDRYRQVQGSADLRRVLVLARSDQSEELAQLLDQFSFEHIHTLADLNANSFEPHLGTERIHSEGVASALGGLIAQLEPDLLPTTDVLEQYLATKPRPWTTVLFKDCWHVVVAAGLLLCLVSIRWGLQMWVDHSANQSATLATSFDEGRNQMLELDRIRKVLREYQRVDEKVAQASIREMITSFATCLPEDCRLDWCGMDAAGEVILKGTMLQGDRTYEVLKALRELPQVSEVALESVGHSSSYGKSATLFEIHCELSKQPPKPAGGRMTASVGSDLLRQDRQR